MAKSSGLKNGPSKTGNPSGTGRANAPTSSTKTPPPAPKSKK